MQQAYEHSFVQNTIDSDFYAMASISCFSLVAPTNLSCYTNATFTSEEFYVDLFEWAQFNFGNFFTIVF